MLIKESALKNFINYTGKTPMLKSPPTKPQALRLAALLKRDATPAPHMKLAKLSRTPLSTEHFQ